MAKQKFYVVWEGVTPGIYSSWTDCQLQIKGYEGAKYKSFDSREEAERALASSPYAYIGKNATNKKGNKPTSVSYTHLRKYIMQCCRVIGRRSKRCRKYPL